MRRIGYSAQSLLLYIIPVLFLLTVFTSPSQSQSFDHEPYPKLDFNFESLTLDLGIQPQNLRVNGAASYTIKASVSGADTLTVFASHIDISSVAVNRSSVDYSLHNDSLFIPVTDSSTVGTEYEVNIRYSGSPKFGLLRNSQSTAWTSLLPKAQRHWVPIVDNPNVELKTTINFVVPSGYHVWATGRKTSEEVASVDAMRYQFSSEQEIPASSLSFAVGKFNSRTTKYGIKTINLATEQALSDSIDSQQLLQTAYDFLGAIEDSLAREYPFEQLNIVIMEDHTAETKSWGASTVFIYKNAGALKSQMLRGIIAQWFGILQRETEWSQSDAITLYQLLLSQSIAETQDTLKQNDWPDFPSSIYDGFGIQRWNQWQQGWDLWQNVSAKKIIAEAQNSVLETQPTVISWEDYAKYWYRQSGQPLFDIPGFTRDTNSVATPTTSNQSDSVAYKVTYGLNEADGQLTLTFESLHGVYKELTTIEAYEVYSTSTDTSEVTFTGAQDSVVLKVDPMISTLQLKAPDRPGLFLDEYKPASFLIYELREGTSVKQRREAARKLGTYTENPDLQLAIRDLMNQDLAPSIKAALLQSFGDITGGATGTEEIFLKALQDTNKLIRDAALMSLQHYKDNASVKNRVQQLVNNAGQFDRFKKATQVLMAISTPAEFNTFADEIVQQDSVGEQSIFIIQQLANNGAVDEAISKAGTFTEEEYSYSIRSRALGILIQHDHAPGNWLTRAKELLKTSDPRIRFLVVAGLEKNINEEITNFLSDYIQDEYDARVYYKIEKLL